jgi:ABC-type glycerol-3-phosphate transport system substrate-binding protein
VSRAWLSAFAVATALVLPSNAEPGKIRYMDWKLNDSKEILELYQVLAKDFEAKNLDIKVELVPVQWEQRMQKLMTEMQAGVPPDVARVSVVDMGAIFPLLQRVDEPLKALGATTRSWPPFPRNSSPTTSCATAPSTVSRPTSRPMA